MARRIFIGDIQGCREELERLLEETRYDPATDALEPVGDLVNRGPDSPGTLRLLRSLGAEGVLGNHDLHLLRTAAGKRELRAGDTLEEVLAAPDRRELLDWLASKPFVRTWPDLTLVHAGLHPRWEDPEVQLAGKDPLEPSDDVEFVTRVRTCDAQGGRHEPGQPWYEYYDPANHGNRKVVFGHWAAQGLLIRPHVIGLDSGCVWGGKLTAWIAEEDRIVQVPAQRAYARK
jgi:bis(5'-nucleosyl)-tetraphosphatase (symmetrical)